MLLAEKYLHILVHDMHSVVTATVDEENHPVTRVIDIMLADDRTFYFLTAKGKAFYTQLMKDGYISLTGMCGGEGLDKTQASMHTKAVSIRGRVKCIGSEKLEEIFRDNPYMAEIYPSEASREALTVFTMTEGTGEFFDLSTKPITRESFPVGRKETAVQEYPYLISDACTGCGRCISVCPQNCILADSVPYRIDQKHCLHCGNCCTDCPAEAVIRR